MKRLLFVSLIAVLGVLTIFVRMPEKAEAGKNIFDKGTEDELERAKQISLSVLRTRAAQRGVGNADEFTIQKVEIDDLKMAHMRVSQTVGGVPVWGGEAIVHLKQNGELFAVTDDLKEAIAVSTEPNFSSDEAINLAKTMYRGAEFLTAAPRADLWIYRGAKRDHLVYRVAMRREDGSDETAMPVIFVDAQTGEKVFEYDNLQTGTGTSLYSGTVSINTYRGGATYYLEDRRRKIGTFNMSNSTTTASRFTNTNDIWNSNYQRAAVDAHYGAAKFYDYFLNIHGRHGIDGSGGPGSFLSADGVTNLVQSRVHYGNNFNNAFWNGQFMTYGDGDGSLFSPLVTLDICGHEMTHGVTERTAGLVYSGESGALNESISDIFGAMVERYARGETADTWKIGEDAFTPATNRDALRYLNNPHLASDGGFTSNDDPDHYDERYRGTSDNGGVHTNSGIGNKAFYLLAKGGTHHLSGVTVTGIGTDDAAKIWYLALTRYMTSSTNFSGARSATLLAAFELFGAGSPQSAAVEMAWCAVGVGICPAGGPELIVNGGFESSLSPWVSSGTGVFYTANGNTPFGGTGYIYFGEGNSVSGQIYQTVSIPAEATGNLTFWLNVTSSETTTTTQYDRLFVEVRDTSGTKLSTLATYSNLDKGTTGIYLQKSASLAAYRGQTVRVQFRVSTDSSLPTTFLVDNVALN